MFVLSGFADEISADLSAQLDVLEELGLRYLELRGVWGKNVLALDDSEAKTIKAELDGRGMRVSAIGSPIGKIRIDDPFEPHLVGFPPGHRLGRVLWLPLHPHLFLLCARGPGRRLSSSGDDSA